MSKSASKALGALLRWREWDESQAQVALAQSSQALDSARARSQAQRDAIDAIQERRGQMLEGAIDPAVLQLAAAIEDEAWRTLEARRSDEEQATDRHAVAHQALLDARGRVRVVEARHARVATSERDRQEKAMFDRMADLHVQSRRQNHD